MPETLSRLRDNELDLVFHALSDRTRRAMLRRLSTGPAKITELASPFAMSLPAVSKHLRVLENAKLVRRSVRGRTHMCALDVKSIAEAESWLNLHRIFWQQSLDRLATQLETGKPGKSPAQRRVRGK